jgi:catechol 2,3-dioxygenase-like lactoylglutathione lyase family enzyme
VTPEAVIYVKDLGRMVAFYERGLGFAVVEEDEGHAVLESGAWSLQLVRVPAEVAAEINIAVPRRGAARSRSSWHSPSRASRRLAAT